MPLPLPLTRPPQPEDSPSLIDGFGVASESLRPEILPGFRRRDLTSLSRSGRGKRMISYTWESQRNRLWRATGGQL